MPIIVLHKSLDSQRHIVFICATDDFSGDAAARVPPMSSSEILSTPAYASWAALPMYFQMNVGDWRALSALCWAGEFPSKVHEHRSRDGCCQGHGGATTTGPDATYPPAICQNSGGGGVGGGGPAGGRGRGSCRGSGGGGVPAGGRGGVWPGVRGGVQPGVKGGGLGLGLRLGLALGLGLGLGLGPGLG